MPDSVAVVAKAGGAHASADLAGLREKYRSGKTAIFKSLADSGASSRNVRSLLQKLARHTDATLQLLWQRADFPAESCLVATGGFGRGELFPRQAVERFAGLALQSLQVGLAR